MIRDKKAGKNFDEIGKKWYNFDPETEKMIYRYLCCFRIKRNKLNTLHKDLRFDTYQQWKHYVCDKYSNYRNEELMEFSRYLNYERRLTISLNKYLEMIMPILISLLFANSFGEVCNKYFEIIKNTNLLYMVLLSCLGMVVIIFLIYQLIKTFYPMLENNIDENFYADYKEIIDEIVERKTKSKCFPV